MSLYHISDIDPGDIYTGGKPDGYTVHNAPDRAPVAKRRKDDRPDGLWFNEDTLSGVPIEPPERGAALLAAILSKGLHLSARIVAAWLIDTAWESGEVRASYGEVVRQIGPRHISKNTVIKAFESFPPHIVKRVSGGYGRTPSVYTVEVGAFVLWLDDPGFVPA
jgi:hypothetical protein